VFPKWKESNLFNIDRSYFQDQFGFENRYEERHFWYEEIPFIKNVSLHGYFQSEKYFEHCKEDVIKMLMPKNTNPSGDYCSVHVRRGDYTRLSDFHTNLGIAEYYFKAMELIPNCKFVIVSDDPIWCKQNFTGNDFTIKDFTSPIDDFKTLVASRHNIIANSSFSWWGAYLNRNPDKKVIAPSNWFGPKLKNENPIHDLIPKDWRFI
jgi:hypothetical protein